ncbi:hypothetical protein FKM82_021576 [Ascaphus truei]
MEDSPVKYTVHMEKPLNTIQSHKGHMHCYSAIVDLTVVFTGIVMAFCNPTKLHSHILWPEWSFYTAGFAFCPQFKDTQQKQST